MTAAARFAMRSGIRPGMRLGMLPGMPSGARGWRGLAAWLERTAMRTFALALVAAALAGAPAPAGASDRTAGAPEAADEVCQAGETIIRFSHVVADTGHPKGDAARLLARRVNTELDGQACMLVFANSELFDDDDVMEALLLGEVQLAAPSLAKFEAYTLRYRLFDLPFLFDDLAAVNRFTASTAGQDLLNAMSDLGFVGLGYWNSGMKQFSARKPLLVPADAAGLVFRIQPSDVAEAMIAALGATSRKLAFRDVRDALASGAVDGQENTWSNVFTQGFHEVQDGITETNHQLLAYLVVASRDWLDGLAAETRQGLLRIIGEVTLATNAEVAAMEAANRQRILDAGSTIRVLTPEQRTAWQEAMKPVWRQFEEEIGADLIAAARQANREP